MKQFLLTIKEWIVKEKKFLIILSALLVSLFVSMFTEWALIACILTLVVGAIVCDFEKCLSLFLFCYSFEGIFYIRKADAKVFIFPLVYSVLFLVCFLKYLILIFKKKKSINWKTLVPILLVLLYIVIPIHSIKVVDILKYVVAFGVIYLLLEYRNEINFDKMLIYISISLITSIVFSLFVGLSQRMDFIIGEFYNHDVRKMQALFTNPNWFAVYCTLILAWLSYNFVFKDHYWGIPILVLLPCSYATLSRDFILCLIITMVFLLIMICIKRKKIPSFKYLSLVLFVVVIIFSQFSASKMYVRRLESIYGEALSLFGIEVTYPESDEVFEDVEVDTVVREEFWIDGSPLDPGRSGLWKRYYNDFKSSTVNILFGTGVSAEILGVEPHNTFINIVWQYGIIGAILMFGLIFWLIFKELIKGKSLLSCLMLALICFISLFESNLFNYVAIMMIIMLMASTYKVQMEDTATKEKIVVDNTSEEANTANSENIDNEKSNDVSGDNTLNA